MYCPKYVKILHTLGLVYSVPICEGVSIQKVKQGIAEEKKNGTCSDTRAANMIKFGVAKAGVCGRNRTLHESGHIWVPP